MSVKNIVRIGLIGAGRMGSFHGETVAQRVPGATLIAVADPVPGAAEKLAARLGAKKSYTDPQDLLNDPEIDAVVIASPARTHAELVVAAAKAGKAYFVRSQWPSPWKMQIKPLMRLKQPELLYR